MAAKVTSIKVETLSKIYRIGLWDESQDNLLHAAWGFLKSPIKNYRKYRSLYRFDDLDEGWQDQSAETSQDTIWALRAVSFEVKRGEVLGIIGKNGAGKSTLLKILSRIVEPTKGYAEIRGRVSSLLEVGTGFHQELTGRENVFLNGTILGMKKQEVKRKFDEIVAFSGIEKFIDTPVKRYSSGMKVRLAFSVAAHLEPEILIVDEVLAVGDAEFQRKCLGRMEAVGKKGRTVLLVSHNMSAITGLCERAIWLDQGRVKLDGPSHSVVSAYLDSGSDQTGEWLNQTAADENHPVRLQSARIKSETGEIKSAVSFHDPFVVEVSYELIRPIMGVAVFCQMTDSFGNVVLTSWDVDSARLDGLPRGPGFYCSICKIPGRLMKPGRYTFSFGAMIPWKEAYGVHENVLSFEVSSVKYPFNANRQGVITPLLEWEVERRA